MDINELSGDSRVWIYQAERFLRDEEVILIKRKLEEFIDQWSSHGQKMQASAEIYYDRLVVIAADEARAIASGCGIDKSVNFMKDLQLQMGIDFFQRMQVLYLIEGKLNEAPLHHFWAQRKAGLISDNTIVIDSTVKNLALLRQSLEVPFNKSWHGEMWQR